MPNQAYNALAATRLTRVLQSLQYIHDLPEELYFLNRTPIVDATDAEITARFFGRVQIADIIADDQQAAVYSFQRWTTETTNIPNLKLGIQLTQAQINQLQMLESQMSGAAGQTLLTNFYASMGKSLMLGIRQRWEALIIAAKTDAIHYDRMGIKITGGGFGMPSDLKITTGVTWDTPSTATPVADIFSAQQLGRQRYGIVYDRLIMSTSAFQYMTLTTDFQNRVRLYFNANPSVTAAAIGVANVQSMLALAAPALGVKEIALYDARYWSQATDGTIASTRFLPVNQVILDSIANDNRADVMDIGNAITTESIVGQIARGGVIGDLPAGQYGPMAYATLANENMNPPGITAWGVARSWPRRFLQQQNAVLTVGTFTDTIPTSAPFPIS